MSDQRGFLDELPPAAPRETVAAAPGWIAGTEGSEGPIRHSPVAILPAPDTNRGMAPLVVAVVALLTLILGVSGLELANFVVAQFDRAGWLGWLTVAILLPAVLVLAWSLVREWKGFVALKRVDAIRQGLLSEDLVIARTHARNWLASIQVSDPSIETILAASDVPTLRSLLRSGPIALLDEQSANAGRSAALQVLAATAVSPWPGLDGAIVVWRGLRLVRRIAEIYGLRPGALGTLRLWLRITMDATTVAAADVATTALVEAFFNSPMAGALVGQATGAAVAARRMLRLSAAVAQWCRPLP